ncbi:hypothetical protein KIH31_17470 [Paenarthrobacter sp. DKR-5]|uniref:hypothetical protein n=1 Tax=Paenarthrobacter sp. DKR-5 TaxID=2835535 RepID=UPI001BDCC2C7|nr:hypothetical protein [Paenarthrobacter sp. DKR-5]MBT1004379.1 hypothetical protein [Paenarthrobacter sp. DKR-5]
MLNDNLRPVLVAAADLETVQWEMDQAVQLLEEAMRRALLEGIALDRVASAAGMTAGEVISRTGMQLRGLAAPGDAAGLPREHRKGEGPDRALEPA